MFQTTNHILISIDHLKIMKSVNVRFFLFYEEKPVILITI